MADDIAFRNVSSVQASGVGDTMIKWGKGLSATVILAPVGAPLHMAGAGVNSAEKILDGNYREATGTLLGEGATAAVYHIPGVATVDLAMGSPLANGLRNMTGGTDVSGTGGMPDTTPGGARSGGGGRGETLT